MRVVEIYKWLTNDTDVFIAKWDAFSQKPAIQRGLPKHLWLHAILCVHGVEIIIKWKKQWITTYL